MTPDMIQGHSFFAVWWYNWINDMITEPITLPFFQIMCLNIPRKDNKNNESYHC